MVPHYTSHYPEGRHNLVGLKNTARQPKSSESFSKFRASFDDDGRNGKSPCRLVLPHACHSRLKTFHMFLDVPGQRPLPPSVVR